MAFDSFYEKVYFKKVIILNLVECKYDHYYKFHQNYNLRDMDIIF